MSWIQNNKGPAALLGVTALGAVGLGALWFQAWSGASASREQYDMVVAGISSLRSARLEPTEANLAKKQAMVAEYGAAVTKLNEDLRKLQPAVENITNTDFQSKLKKKVADIKKEAGAKLPAQFNLGFDGYENELPKSDALASELSSYLDASDQVVRLALKSGVIGIDSLERSPLAAEKPAAAGGANAPARPAQPGMRTNPAAALPSSPVQRRTLTLTLRCDQDGLQKFLSSLANPAEMKFFTVARMVRIENEVQVGPPRVIGGAVPAGDAAATPTNPEPTKDAKEEKPKGIAPAAPDSQVVLGAELLRAYLEIDLVEFVAQATSATR
jgi:hypothetical protein